MFVSKIFKLLKYCFFYFILKNRYKCQNGHIYAVGNCGMLNQGSICPDCGARIGGGTNNARVTV